MGTEFEKQVVKALDLISQTANEAWWANHSTHCGSGFNLLTCQPCFAYEQCKRNEELIHLFGELIPAVG